MLRPNRETRNAQYRTIKVTGLRFLALPPKKQYKVLKRIQSTRFSLSGVRFYTEPYLNTENEQGMKRSD